MQPSSSGDTVPLPDTSPGVEGGAAAEFVEVIMGPSGEESETVESLSMILVWGVISLFFCPFSFRLMLG